MAFLFPVKQDAERISKYKEHIDKVKYNKINFPGKIKDIPKIENMNDIQFNVFSVDDKKSIYALYISNKICDKTCNLLLIENDNKNHYVWIKDFNKLMNTQSKHKNKLFFCYHCLQHFTSENILKNHTEVCLKINGAHPPPPKKKKKKKNICFTNYHKQLMAPFVIYADFECITVPIKEEHGKQTVAYQEH